MDLPQNPLAPLPNATETDLPDQLRSLRMLLAALLAAMLCFGGALMLYLYRQVSMLNRQVTENTRLVNEFQTNTLPKINWFFNSLQTFARTNPDFNSVLAKYNLLPGPASAPAPSKAGSAPIAPTPKK